MKPSPPARFRLRERWEEREAEGGIGGCLQLLLLLLLGLLRETVRRAGRSAGEQRLDECARLHAAAESIRRVAANAIDDADAFPQIHASV